MKIFKYFGNPGAALAVIASFLSITILALLLRPYDGIRHDSILYFGQALHVLMPQELGRDLFFAYGSQSSYTVFPQVLAYWLRWFSPAVVSMAGILLAFATFMVGSALFARIAIPHKLFLFSLLALVILPSGYGGFGVFRFQEPYLTGRSFAEPLVIIAVVAMISGRHWWALLPLIFALLIHPLQALAGFAVWWALLAYGSRRWLFLPIIFGVAVFALGLINVSPFDKFISRYDREWLEVIAEPNKNVYMTQWPPASWIWLLIDYFLLFTAAPLLTDRVRRYAVSLLGVSTLYFALSLIFVDLFDFVWFAGVQLWRVHWLLHWSALIFVPVVCLHLWENKKKTQLALFLATLLVAAPYGPFASVFAALILIPLYFLWPWIAGRVGYKYVLLLHFALIFSILGTYTRYLLYLVGFRGVWDFVPDWSKLILGLTHPVVLLPIALGGLYLWLQKASYRASIVVVLLISIIGAISMWDQRSSAKKLIESTQSSSEIFGHAIEPGATVFWYADLLAPWVLLQRPSYWSDLQQAGLLFNRGTAIEAHRRESILQPFLMQAELCRIMDNLNKKYGSCEVDISSLHEPCHDREIRLDYLILPHLLPIKKLGEFYLDDGLKWNAGALADGGRLYLYSCKDVP